MGFLAIICFVLYISSVMYLIYAMPVSHRIDNDAKLIITTCEGEAIDSDFIEAVKKYQSDFQNKPDCLDYNEIVDLSKVSRFRLSAKGLINIGKVASSTDKYRAKTKLAFIVSTELAFNITKLYATYRNFGLNNKKKIRVFKKESDALEWIHDDS